MTAKIIKWPYPSAVDLPPEKILNELPEACEFEGVLVLGFLKNGDEFFASSYADGGDIMWLMELAKYMMLEWAQKHSS